MDYMLQAWFTIVSHALHMGWEVTFTPLLQGESTIVVFNPHDMWQESRTIRLTEDLLGCQLDILEEATCWMLGHEAGLFEVQDWCKYELTEWRASHRYNKSDFLNRLQGASCRCKSALANELIEQAEYRYRKACNNCHDY